MNADGLAQQAAGLTSEARGTLGLLIAWTLAPVLRLDRNVLGQQRARAAEELFESAVRNLGNLPASMEVEAAIASSEELEADEEPEGLGAFRVDFLATLLYAVRSYTQDSIQDLRWCLRRAEDSLGFLHERFPASEADEIDDATLEAISDLMGRPSVGREDLTQLQPIFQRARLQIEQAVESIAN